MMALVWYHSPYRNQLPSRTIHVLSEHKDEVGGAGGGAVGGAGDVRNGQSTWEGGRRGRSRWGRRWEEWVGMVIGVVDR